MEGRQACSWGGGSSCDVAHLGAVNGDCLLECNAICRLAVVGWLMLVLVLILGLGHRDVPTAAVAHVSIGGGAWVPGQGSLACPRHQLCSSRLAPAAAGHQQAQAQKPEQAGAHSRSQDDPQACKRGPKGCEHGSAGQSTDACVGWAGGGTKPSTIQDRLEAGLRLGTA